MVSLKLVNIFNLLNGFCVQLDALKRTVDRTVTDLESTRSHVTQLKKDVQDKENRWGSITMLDPSSREFDY